MADSRPQQGIPGKDHTLPVYLSISHQAGMYGGNGRRDLKPTRFVQLCSRRGPKAQHTCTVVLDTMKLHGPLNSFDFTERGIRTALVGPIDFRFTESDQSSKEG